ncbi:MAG: tyrosine-type recombinase/integrase [Flavobacteriales bacterium]|nr:tyrosine-type recombinase/integrase [Flavobacteriales bacterium]
MRNFLQSFLEYLEKEKNYSPLTLKSYGEDITFFIAHLEEEHPELQIQEVSYVFIRNWIVSMVEQGLQNVSINRKISSLQTFFKFLRKTNVLTENPLAKHQPLKKQKKVQVPFSVKEMENLQEFTLMGSDYQEILHKTLIDFFYATGVRKSELIELKFSQVDFGKNQIKVLGKRNKERIIPMIPALKQSLEVYAEARSKFLKTVSDDFFFVNKNGVKLNQTFVYRLINSYLSIVSEKAKKSPHVLRHTFATHLLNQGADINSVKELLGHSSLASTQVYTHSSLAELQQVYQNAHPRNQE